jgi:hypothetical protein
MSAITDLAALLPPLKTQLEQKAAREANARGVFASTLTSARGQDSAYASSVPAIDTTAKDFDAAALATVLDKMLTALQELQASSFSLQAVGVPASLSAPGSPGQYCADTATGAFYLCVAANQWVKLSMVA